MLTIKHPVSFVNMYIPERKTSVPKLKPSHQPLAHKRDREWKMFQSRVSASILKRNRGGGGWSIINNSITNLQGTKTTPFNHSRDIHQQQNPSSRSFLYGFKSLPRVKLSFISISFSSGFSQMIWNLSKSHFLSHVVWFFMLFSGL